MPYLFMMNGHDMQDMNFVLAEVRQMIILKPYPGE
jgi:hypothetical protein